jgi:hypothetical protein
MRRPIRHPLIVLLCALGLLGAQQAAYAHFLSHLGIAAETAVRAGGDAEHGAAATLSHVCTTCAAFSAAGAAPPSVPPALPIVRAIEAAIAAPPVGRLAAVATPPCGARAPPAVL